jgi:hypothetical protein
LVVAAIVFIFAPAWRDLFNLLRARHPDKLPRD